MPGDKSPSESSPYYRTLDVSQEDFVLCLLYSLALPGTWNKLLGPKRRRPVPELLYDLDVIDRAVGLAFVELQRVTVSVKRNTRSVFSQVAGRHLLFEWRLTNPHDRSIQMDLIRGLLMGKTPSQRLIKLRHLSAGENFAMFSLNVQPIIAHQAISSRWPYNPGSLETVIDAFARHLLEATREFLRSKGLLTAGVK